MSGSTVHSPHRIIGNHTQVHSAFGKYSVPDFVTLQSYFKMYSIFFPLINQYTIPYNDKVNTGFLNVLQICKKTEVPYLYKYSDPLL
jgi:hypothetical protein